ncbi:MAG: hypothetical protein ACREOD_03940 [Candidatus Dormibacteria bacterium]
MILSGALAAAGFAAGAVALFSTGAFGAALTALAVGLGLGAVASLSAGATGFATLASLGAAGALLIWVGGRLPVLNPAIRLLGPGLTAGKPRVFGERGLRAVLGGVGLFTARLLSGHLSAGTVTTQGPAFACLFVFEVGLIRIGTGRGPRDLGVGGFCAGMGAAAFIWLSLPTTVPAVALLCAGVPAGILVVLARATPWETSV